MGRADEWDQSNVEIFGSKGEVLTRTRGPRGGLAGEGGPEPTRQGSPTRTGEVRT